MGRITPLIWNYDIQSVIGSAEYREDGTMVMTVQDPALVDRFKHTHEFVNEVNTPNSIYAVSLSHQEARPTKDLIKENKMIAKFHIRKARIGYFWYAEELDHVDPIVTSGWRPTFDGAVRRARKEEDRIVKFSRSGA